MRSLFSNLCEASQFAILSFGLLSTLPSLGVNIEGPPPHLKFFGYYYDGPYIEQNWAAGNNSNNQNAAQALKLAELILAQTNIVWIAPGDPNYQVYQMQLAISQKRKFIVDVQNVFMENNFRLRVDYLAAWQQYSQLIRPYAENLAAFYPLDEPNLELRTTASGLSWFQISDQMKRINLAIKQAFPEKPIAVIFGDGKGPADYLNPSFRIPDGYDWVAFDSYGHWNESNKVPIPTRISILESKMNSSQFFFLVPDGYSYGRIPSQSEELRWIDRANKYYQACASNKRCIALIPFIYQNLPPAAPGYSPSYGIISMPALAQEFRKMGLSIVASSNQIEPDMPPPLYFDHGSLGVLENVVSNSDGSTQLNGWTCAKNFNRSLRLRVFLGGDSKKGKNIGDFKSGLPNEPYIEQQCLARGGGFRFSITINSKITKKHRGKTIFVYGLNPFVGTNGIKNIPLNNSGNFNI